jgi:hypothetical protein
MNEYLADYEKQKGILLNYIIHNSHDNKHSVITQLLHNRVINKNVLDGYCKRIRDFIGDSDFVMIVLARILYLIDVETLEDVEFKSGCIELIDNICNSFSEFPFWPPKKEHVDKDISRMCFWTENHIFMTLSSAYLYFQHEARKKNDLSFEFENCLDSQLLLKYLEIHCHPSFGIAYEGGSHVYLPYSLCSLWNLYDFAENPIIKERAEIIIDRMVYLLMLGVDPQTGVGNLTAASRDYARMRLRNFGHNINSFISVMNSGRNTDFCEGFFAMSDFFLTTKWIPKREAFEAIHFNGFISQLPVSHDLQMIEEIFGKANILNEKNQTTVDEWTPLYWSAGLIPHPAMAAKTRFYQRNTNLNQRKSSCRPLSYLFFSDDNFASWMNSYSHFSKGNQYTGFKLNVYKQPEHGLVSTSFHCYNPHGCGYQQIPWMANISGAPLWSQSGLGSESMLGFGIFNTHNPAVQQDAEIMLITYLTPKAIQGFVMGKLFHGGVRFFWPIPLFEKHWVKRYGKQFHEEKQESSEDNEKLPQQNCSSFSWFPFGSSSTTQNPATVSVPPAHRSALFPSEEDQSLLKSEESRSWCIGQRGQVYVAVLCTKPVTVDDKETKDAIYQEGKSRESHGDTILPRLYCERNYHSWVLVFGTVGEYDSVEAFVNEKLSKMQIVETESKDSSHKKIYKIAVTDGSASSGKRLTYEYNLEDEVHIAF